LESTPQTDWKSGLRTAAFAVLGAAILVSIVVGPDVPFAEERIPAETSLLMRGGDNFMGAYYIVVDAGLGEDRAESLFLEHAHRFYRAAMDAEPDDFHARLSTMFVLRGLGMNKEAADLVTPWRRGQFSGSERKALGAAYAMVVSQHPAPSAMETAHDYLFEMGPGPLLIATAYRDIDDEARAQETLAEAAARSEPLLRRLIIATVVNALIVLSGVVWVVWRVLRRKSRARPEGEAEAPLTMSLGPREAVEALILWAFFSTAFAQVVSAVSWGEEGFALALLSPSLLAAIVAIGWVWLVTRPGSALGWRLSSLGGNAVLGVVAAGLSVIPVLLLYSFLLELRGGSPAENPLVRLLTVPDSLLARAGIVIGVGLVGPAVEEMLFRGIVFAGLRSRWSFWAAAGGSAALFAFAHLSLAGFASLFLLGLLFAYLFERSRSLVAPWAAHAAFNIFNLAMLMTLFGSFGS
jgi:membrane protease YdiL (CAAX protease family)